MSSNISSAINNYITSPTPITTGSSAISSAINNYMNSSTTTGGSAISNAINAYMASPPVGSSSWWSSASSNFGTLSGMFGANAVNATVTGLFSAFAALSSFFSASAVQQYYQRQEQEYIRNAEEQARRLQLKGDIALRNLRYEHKLEQGTNEIAVAAAGGNLSGSNLDMLAQNHKYNVLDERTQQIETLWAVSDAKRSGFVNAISTAGNAQATAYKSQSNAWKALANYVQGVSSGLLADKRADDTNKSRAQIAIYDYQRGQEFNNWYYNDSLLDMDTLKINNTPDWDQPVRDNLIATEFGDIN